jgi:acyl-CoA thioester hydrolase
MIKPAKIQVRFADLDTMGHVNNAVYLSYFEMARVHYFKELLGAEWNWQKAGVLMVRNEVDYVQPVLLTNEPEISVFLEELGTKSIRLGYELKVGERICTKGSSVMVTFDSTVGRTIPVPDEMRTALLMLKKPE